MVSEVSVQPVAQYWVTAFSLLFPLERERQRERTRISIHFFLLPFKSLVPRRLRTRFRNRLESRTLIILTDPRGCASCIATTPGHSGKATSGGPTSVCRFHSNASHSSVIVQLFKVVRAAIQERQLTPFRFALNSGIVLENPIPFVQIKLTFRFTLVFMCAFLLLHCNVASCAPATLQSVIHFLQTHVPIINIWTRERIKNRRGWCVRISAKKQAMRRDSSNRMWHRVISKLTEGQIFVPIVSSW